MLVLADFWVGCNQLLCIAGNMFYFFLINNRLIVRNYSHEQILEELFHIPPMWCRLFRYVFPRGAALLHTGEARFIVEGSPQLESHRQEIIQACEISPTDRPIWSFGALHYAVYPDGDLYKKELVHRQSIGEVIPDEVINFVQLYLPMTYQQVFGQKVSSNWFHKLCQKSMPLPFKDTVPSNPTGARDGRYLVDKQMDDSMSRKEEQQHPEMKYLGHGGNGVAYENQGDRVVKYTTDRSEWRTACYVYKRPVQCIVRVLEYPEVLSASLFKIVTEKVKQLATEEKDYFWTNPQLQPKILQLEQCLQAHRYKLTELDVHNVGWNKDGDLVMLDMGGLI